MAELKAGLTGMQRGAPENKGGILKFIIWSGRHAGSLSLSLQVRSVIGKSVFKRKLKLTPSLDRRSERIFGHL